MYNCADSVMDSKLPRTESLQTRLEIGYEDAGEASAEVATAGIVAAPAAIDENQAGRKNLLALGAEIINDVRKLVANGPFRRLRVKYGNKLVNETPMAMTAAAALAVVVAAVLISKLVIEVDRGEEGTAG